MIRLLGLTICLFYAALPTVARASDGLEFIPFVGYRLGGSTLNELSPTPPELEQGENWGFSFVSASVSSTRYEFLYSRLVSSLSDSTDSRDAFDLDVHYLHLGGTVALPHEELVPFFSGGIDMTHLNTSRAGYANGTRLSLSLGGGLKWTPNDRFGIRFELRGYGTLADSRESLFCASDCEQGLRSYLFPQFETNLGLIYRF